MPMQALEVIQDVPTHWNSEHAMLVRLLKLWAPIAVELSGSDSVENLSAQEWKLMNAVVRVLQPLQQATAKLSADHYPTLSQVIPLLHCTRVMLEEHASGADKATPFASRLLHGLSTRFPDIRMAKVPALAMPIDPRFESICYTAEAENKWSKVACVYCGEACAITAGTLLSNFCRAGTSNGCDEHCVDYFFRIELHCRPENWQWPCH
ncbi:hypothetical protein HPB48_008776 [Haemaphysalis longicornis]|uniref:Uncharacterized protein n=1 Tax=Haemaphysalis longicornis TaxID=44386 RepID=A0A9J6FVD1_HAELO|nr:hypothetical protein HPB48_008776 [Haemaphysalis longicornis]